jgi:hypothetical protein
VRNRAIRRRLPPTVIVALEAEITATGPGLAPDPAEFFTDLFYRPQGLGNPDRGQRPVAKGGAVYLKHRRGLELHRRRCGAIVAQNDHIRAHGWW